jgi:hypothetical protein
MCALSALHVGAESSLSTDTTGRRATMGTICISAAAVVTFLAAAVANDLDTIVLVAVLAALLGMLWSLVGWGTWSPDGRPADDTALSFISRSNGGGGRRPSPSG